MRKQNTPLCTAMLTAYAFLYTATLREAHQAASRAPTATGLLLSYGNYAAMRKIMKLFGKFILPFPDTVCKRNRSPCFDAVRHSENYCCNSL